MIAYNVGNHADILGSFEQAVLLAIVRVRDGAYGRAILKEVQARLERDVPAGAVHTTLDRLEGKGLVSSRLGSGTEIRNGRAHGKPAHPITIAWQRAGMEDCRRRQDFKCRCRLLLP
jgi:hypothetical protein